MRFVVNGIPHETSEGRTILSALGEVGIHVPHLCADERLAPGAVCRLCLVKVDGLERPVPACSTMLTEGMCFETHAPALEEQRRGVLRMMAWSYPPSNPNERDNNDFLTELRNYGLEHERHARSRVGTLTSPPVDRHPYIHVDLARCIACRRCEQICRDLEGHDVWSFQHRGARRVVVPDSGTTLHASSCVSCGACVDTCPSGALTDRTVGELGPPTWWTRTTCPYCGVGCELSVGTRSDRIVQVRPARDAPVNRGHLCVKGRYAFGFVEARDRLSRPLLRGTAGLREVSWDEALDYVADRLATIRTNYGADALYVLGSARATNEENYLTQKFARVVLGTNNVDCCARVCHAPSAAGLFAMLGTGAATNSFDDIERAHTLLVVGSNATENHPVVGARVIQAARHGARLIVIDPRRTELAAHADIHLQLRPGTNIPLLNAMAATLLEEELVDRSFIAARIDGEVDLARHLARYTAERVAETCGVAAGAIRRAARMYALNAPAMALHGLGVTEHVQGTAGVMCIVNLALLTGNIGKPGSGVNPLRGQNNVQGSAHMGCEPHHLTGYLALDEGRTRAEAVWGAKVPTTRGLDMTEMIDAAADGKIKALYAIGYDVLLTNPDATRTRAALSKLELVIAQDPFRSTLARELAHVVLPATTAFEKDGTFMNAERRVQRVRQAVAPRGEARSDQEILCALAKRMGEGARFRYASPEAVWDEVRLLWPAGAGMSYARLDQRGLQWPCPSEDHPGTSRLHVHQFAGGPRAVLRCIDYTPTPEQRSDEYPFVLMTGRKLYQFNAGTMTERTPNHLLQPGDVLDMAPADAARLALEAGDRVEVRSRSGATKLRLRVDPGLRPGELFATFHTAEVFINLVTRDHTDAVTHAPEYKITAVSVTRCAPLVSESGQCGSTS